MAVSLCSFFAFLLVVPHLVSLNFATAAAAEKYQPNCPESFNFCGSTTGNIRFPFTNDTYPGCGLCTVSCSGGFPIIQLVRGQLWYPFKEIRADVIIIPNNNLRNLRSSRSCELFNDAVPLPLSFLSTPSISFNTPYAQLLKCSSNSSSRGELDQQIADYFDQVNYHQYQGCPGFTVYYRYPPSITTTNEIPRTPPIGCTAIQLPMLPSTENPKASDVFSILDYEFSIQWNVSKQCHRCHNDRGQCSHDLQEFRCLKDGRRNLKLIIGTAAAGIGVLVVLLPCCCIIIMKFARCESCNFFWKNKTEVFQNVEDFLKNCGPLSPRRYTYSDVKRMTSSFQFQVGQGGYGRVYKGKLENGCLVAVKVLKELEGSVEEFMNEVATIGRTCHVNIVTLLGFCFEGRNRALIYEFMPNGSLEKFIHDRNSLTYHLLGWETLYRISVGIARGLEYLHRGCNTRIVHFDIKPHNILLDEDFCPKISDFGLAKTCPRKESIVPLFGARGTVGYIAPEVFCRNFGGVSHKSDVYSYGMMVLEMVGGRKNIEVEVEHTSEIYFPQWIHQRLELDEELGLHGVSNVQENVSARKMVIVGLWCIQTNPLHRPAMSRVVEMLEGSLDALHIPPKPYLFSPPREETDCSTAESTLT